MFRATVFLFTYLHFVFVHKGSCKKRVLLKCHPVVHISKVRFISDNFYLWVFCDCNTMTYTRLKLVLEPRRQCVIVMCEYIYNVAKGDECTHLSFCCATGAILNSAKSRSSPALT